VSDWEKEQLLHPLHVLSRRAIHTTVQQSFRNVPLTGKFNNLKLVFLGPKLSQMTVGKHFLQMNADLPDWPSNIFLPLFRHLSLNRGRVLVNSAPARKLCLLSSLPRLAAPRVLKLPPQTGRFIDRIA
jgi:hypothetical protein